MPTLIDKLKIDNEKLDNRIKLTQEDKEMIKKLYFDENKFIREITRMYPQVSRRTIQFTLFPERREKVNGTGHWKKYYNKDKHTIAMRKHRQYKNDLLERGLIKTE